MLSMSWCPPPDECESLAVCLSAMLHAAGRPTNCDELVAALGLGGAIVSVRDEPLGAWPAYARDSSLEATAALYGLRLRELHPPDAAVGLERSAEFAQHFEDSYAPLMRRALEHGQRLLAWRGWPAPHALQWGVVTRCDGERFFGRTAGPEEGEAALVGAAHQVYVIEDLGTAGAAGPTPETLFLHAAQQLVAVWDESWSPRADVRTGDAAYADWEAALRAAGGGRTPVDALAAEHAAAARLVAAARRRLAAWLRGVADALEAAHREAALSWASACEQVSGVLMESAQAALGTLDGAAARAAGSEGAGLIDALGAHVQAAARHEDAIQRHLRGLPFGW